MSKNCILCVTNERTGLDLLCDACRQKRVAKCSCGQPKAKHWHLACPACWALIPQPLQDEVYHLFKTAQGSDRHVACVRRCYEAIHAGRPKDPRVEAFLARPRELKSPKPAVAQPRLQWELMGGEGTPSGEMRGFLPSDPGTTLFGVDPWQHPRHGHQTPWHLYGAFIPDDKERTEFAFAGSLEAAQALAELYLHIWLLRHQALFNEPAETGHPQEGKH